MLGRIQYSARAKSHPGLRRRREIRTAFYLIELIKLKGPLFMHRIEAIAENILIDDDDLPQLADDLREIRLVRMRAELDRDTQRLLFAAARLSRAHSGDNSQTCVVYPFAA